MNIFKFDILGRYGGDEFIIGRVHANSETALMVAERIRTAIAEAEINISDATPVKVSVSIGAKCLQNEKTLDELINKDNDDAGICRESHPAVNSRFLI